MDTGHWICEDFDPEEFVGFIYKIISPTGHFYIGRKILWSNTTKPPLKGMKRKRKVRKDSGWREYTSSSKEMNALIVEHGRENFQFMILHLCHTKSEMSYWETANIIMSGSMLHEMGLNFNASKIPCKPKGKS